MSSVVAKSKGGDASSRVNAYLDSLSENFVSRRSTLELIVLAMIAREHVLLIGPPGTGKSAIVQSIARSLDVKMFEYLIGRFTEPSELFGALDLNALKEGAIRPVTEGMLPEADIAFLDEIFLGSTAILNSLLKILNERTYRRGQFSMQAALTTCVGASNALPDDPALAAFADRFLITQFVEPVSDGDLTILLRIGWEGNAVPARRSESSLDGSLLSELQVAALDIDLSGVNESLAHVVRKLRLSGAILSDRKIVKAQKLIAAATVLRGAAQAGVEDLWPVTFLIQSKPQQEEAKDLLAAELRASSNPILTQSVMAATYGPTAHAAFLSEEAGRLLEARPASAEDELYQVWLVRLETLLTRIDAAFSAESAPQHLRVVRASLEGVLDAGASGRPVPAARQQQEPSLPEPS